MEETGKRWLDVPPRYSHQVEVLDVEEVEGGFAVLTAETIFYPGGGGQPEDSGRVDGQELLGVRVDDRGYWHTVATRPASERVLLEVETARRKDHTQQHTGQHVLSAVLLHDLGKETISFHLGRDTATIDLDSPLLSPRELAQAQGAANEAARQCLPITTCVVSPQEAANLPLRRRPDVSDELRVVDIEGLDATACCGTHCTNTAQAAPIIVLRQEKMRKKARLHFVCGARAESAIRDTVETVHELSVSLSVPPERVAGRCSEILAELNALKKNHRATRDAYLLLEAQTRLATEGHSLSGATVLDWLTDEMDASEAARLAGTFCKEPGRLLLLAVAGGERASLIVARSSDVDVSCCDVLAEVAKLHDGRGGGGPTRAQGVFPGHQLEAALDGTMKILRQELLADDQL